MQFISNILKKDPDYDKLLNSVLKNNLPIAASGLSDIHKSVISASLLKHTGRKLLLITRDEPSALCMSDDLKSMGVKALYFPSRDYNLARITGYSKEYEHKRIDTLSSVLDGDFDVLVSSVDAALQYTLPPDILADSLITLTTGSSLNIKSFCEKLLSIGYTRCEITEGAGQFSVRGGIIDIFPPNRKLPLRVELWGDEIDTISEFDTATQRRTETIDGFTLAPACELPYNSSLVAEKLKKYLSFKKLTDKQRENITRDTDALESGIGIPSDLYIPFLYEKIGRLFDYTVGTVTLICETSNIKERIKSIHTLQNEDVKILLEDGLLSHKTSKLRLTASEFWSECENAVFLENFPRASYEMPLRELIAFDYKRSSAWSGDIKVLLDDISYTTSKNGLVVILAGEKKAATVLSDELNANGIPAHLMSDGSEMPESGVFVCTGGLSDGFEIPSLGFCLITHRYVAADTKKPPKRPKNAKEIGSLDELHKGDYVVHTIHGIGIFEGINRITNSGVTKDYIKIKYHGSDTLYVPVTQLDLVSKYIGAATEDGKVKLNRLGSNEWQKTRRRVRAAVKDMAKQLTALYAKRMSVKGYAFSEDTDIQNDFERRFEYEETSDQLRCINEIKNDMQRSVPMDRLLCGDVGFGKTEVALRAAFKCISEGKQCALLVPTTILAMQHYNTVIRRFGDMPVTVRLLSRFVTPKQQAKTVAELKRGSVDMVIGTHRLISKDVEFKNIGLVIIDEEQRFGVAQKERLKELYPFVDILTLSATPIPRTLNMAMSGLRDMSSIDEAPGDRHPVQTYVMEQNTGVIIDAINKEIRRGGQVYYLHNRVDTLPACASRLKERLPNVRFAMAHGKMSEDELSDVWQKLVEHEIDVLVCTTIIETGVDVPNVNTLIIEDADRMGLSQLHQLRGRVGRSPRRAYAYFCFKSGRELSDIASKRLEAIRQFTEFGSGFRIAMRDLEIRGAGSILGGEQHGNMEAVGYDMYLKMLSDAVNEENGIETHNDAVCTVDLNISAHIPESYIESLPARLGIYKRIADIENDDDASDVIDELCDRFGEPPSAVTGLIDIALLRNKAASAGITEITSGKDCIVMHTEKIDPQVAAKLSAAFSDRFNISAINAPAYTVKTPKGEKLADVIKYVISAI